ncbi:MAG: DivIVA domain-containing protein [Nakamurella sp.]
MDPPVHVAVIAGTMPHDHNWGIFMSNLEATDPIRVRPTIRTGSGLITGGWVRAAKFPSAKGLGRGYDRKAVDAFLVECANGVDWLGGLLAGAENEIDRLTAARSSAVGSLIPESGRSESARSIGRAAATLGQRKRPSGRMKRHRLRAAGRPTVSRP